MVGSKGGAYREEDSYFKGGRRILSRKEEPILQGRKNHFLLYRYILYKDGSVRTFI